MINPVYKKMKVLDILIKIFILIIIVPLVATIVPIGPFHFMTVSGTSMEPTITANDIVFVMPANIQPVVGDIISFRHTFSENQTFIVTHRVVEVLNEGYITKGDAYTVRDDYVVAPEDVMGIMRFKIPYIGALVHFAVTTEGLLILVIFPALILIMQEVREIIWLIKK